MAIWTARYFGGYNGSTIVNGTKTNFSLDGATDALERIFQAEEAATITALGFRYNSRTGTPPTYRISLQGVDASGNPDGTVKGGGSPASATFTPPADTSWNNTVQWITLDNAYAVSRGEPLAHVIEYASGTVDASNFSSVTRDMSNSTFAAFPYSISNAAGVRTRLERIPSYGYRSATKTYGLPLKDLVGYTFSADTAGADEYALRFSIPTTLASTYKVAGLRWNSSTLPSAGKTVKFLLYDGTTVLQDYTWDSDWASDTNPRNILFDESTLVTLNGGGVYRLGVQPQESANSVQLLAFVFTDAAELELLPPGVDWYLSKRLDAGAWTDVTTERPTLELILADWTLPAGGGNVFNILE